MGATTDALRHSMRFVGQVGQKALDSFLMPAISQETSAASAQKRSTAETQKLGGLGSGNLGGLGQFGGTPTTQFGMIGRPAFMTTTPTKGIGVRDVVSRQLISQFPSPHQDAPDYMTWDPSGMLLITCGSMAHNIYLHRVLVSPDGGVSFQHAFTLSRGITPALISHISIYAPRAVPAE